jgi:hypothetical protein
MLHKEIWGLSLLFFILWVFFAGQPSDRIDRGCRPVAWSGNVVTSVAALTAPAYQQTTQRWFDGLTYSCQYTAWRLFYQADYTKWVASQQAAAQAQLAVSQAKPPASAHVPVPVTGAQQ